MTDSSETLTLALERLLDAPVETVWEWLTDPELRARWFAGGPIEPREGGTITLVFDHDNLSREPVPYPESCADSKGAAARERIVAYDPPYCIAFTWDGGKEGVARFDLSAEGARTRLRLTHSGITGPAPRASFGGGWTAHLAVLETRIAGGEIENFWEIHAEAERGFGESAR